MLFNYIFNMISSCFRKKKMMVYIQNFNVVLLPFSIGVERGRVELDIIVYFFKEPCVKVQHENSK